MLEKANESVHITKARKKIQQRLNAAEKKVNAETLASMSRLIKMQLNRHKSSRIDLKERQVTTFDQKTPYAKIESQFILGMIKKIKKGTIPPKHDLEGRIKTIIDSNP